MRIVQILAPGRFGGLERVVIQLASGLVGRGHQVSAILVGPEDREAGSLARVLEGAGVHVYPLHTPHRAYGQQRREAGRILRSFNPDVAHTHGYHADVLLASVARGMGVPVATTVHGFTGGGLKNRAFEWLQRRSFRRMDAVVVVSAPIASILQASGVAPTKVVVIRNAWAAPGAILAREEARRLLGLQADAKVVAWLGRFTREKAPDLAVRAMSMVRDPAVSLFLLGAGPLESELQALAQQGVGAHRVRIHGPIVEAWAYLKAFDAVCLSSRTEGTPMVLLEAMAAEVPIVTTSVGGIPDVVGDEHALLVPSGDLGLLARALDRVVTEDQRHRVAAAAARLSETFGPGPWVSRYEELYRTLSAREESP